MTPIHELLNRIRWDAEFGRGNFELGYFDRVEDRIIVVPFENWIFPKTTRKRSGSTDTEGRIHRVPFHRVREAYKEGRRIWHRPQDAQ